MRDRIKKHAQVDIIIHNDTEACNENAFVAFCEGLHVLSPGRTVNHRFHHALQKTKDDNTMMQQSLRPRCY